MKTISKTILTGVAFVTLMACTSISSVQTKKETTMTTNTEKTVELLNSFNTGDTAPIAYINPAHYTQHNLGVEDGLEGFAALMQSAPPQGFSANVHRAFADGDYVVAHTEYDFFGPLAGFDVFRFEDGQIVEHWDNLSAITPPNPSGHTQFDGTTEITDLDQTDANKAVVKGFVDDILIGGKMDKLTDYISTETYIQHNSNIADGLDGFGKAFAAMAANDIVMTFERNHKFLGQGNFVLAMTEGRFGKAPGEPTAFYDLFRLDEGKIVEHWDIIQSIPARADWKNDNGKF